MALNLVSGITKQLGSFITSEFKLTASVKEEIQKLESKFRTIQAVLNDAEKRQVKEEAVKLWLDKLKDVSYEMDDVLDEWNTAMIKAAITKEQDEEKAESSTAKKRKNFMKKLDEIINERQMYGFELSGAIEVVERPKTTSFVDVSEICGRDKVKDDLVSILLGKGSEEERSPHVISLVGMGGIGKTTLAQLAYNDPEVKSHFEKRIWVCVSEPFDQCRVAKAILEAFGGGHPNSTELQSLLEKICELIERKKFFLVLDDVWTEDSTLWEPFRLALKYGAQGSRILVTTRKIRVAEIMGNTSARMINLEVLSEEDCWLVFSKIAFSGKAPEKCDELEVLGRQIAKKCKGLPLAAKTLGSLMRFKISSEQWKNVLDSNLWDLEGVGNVIEKDLFASLFLSYYDLPSPLKRCFSYCAVYPKDYVFSSDELVEMWMAQGYINSKEDMEIIAREYFENLAIRSFFQDFEKDEDDGHHNVSTTMSPNWTMSLTKLKTLRLDYFWNVEHLPPLGKLPVLESLKISWFNILRKVGVEFLGIESENKKEDNMQIFPNLKSLEFESLNQWEEWIGMREEEEDSNITIMPRLQRLVILFCEELNSLPDFLRTIPLKELEIYCHPILHQRCQRGTGEEWPKISHIPNIKIRWQYVQRDGQEVKSEDDEEEFDEEEFDEEESDEEEFDEEESDEEESDEE
uniref:AAA+ ATPase domain-containing protein n=1 Tax=Fagus sylvatica TaxID=28930 RepID=A0A2N9F031_FAGSY